METNNDALHNILLGDDVVEAIQNNLHDLVFVVPEIAYMIGFEHNHPHHHLDVWEHTLYALSLSPNEFDVRLALLLHDIGKPHCYQDDEVRHFKGHPEKSATISKIVLERLGYDSEYIKYICEIVSRHDTPLSADDIISNETLSRIIFEVQKCDALAHNPATNTKRLEYIEQITNLFEQKDKLNNYGQASQKS